MSFATDPRLMALRELTASDGTLWQIYDVAPGSNPRLIEEGRQGGWLVFESDRHKCRIVPVPEGWDLRTDEELFDLMRTATPVPKTRPEAPTA